MERGREIYFLCKRSSKIYIVFVLDSAANIHNVVIYTNDVKCMQIRVWMLYFCS